MVRQRRNWLVPPPPTTPFEPETEIHPQLPFPVVSSTSGNYSNQESCPPSPEIDYFDEEVPRDFAMSDVESQIDGFNWGRWSR